jgi:hypothetical protein
LRFAVIKGIDKFLEEAILSQNVNNIGSNWLVKESLVVQISKKWAYFLLH